jgi:DNA-3-methyladenine glycosylase I
MTEPARCPWPKDDPLYLDYHDNEWGLPLHDDRALFELLDLEGAQAGLSWITILRKRAEYRIAFDNFDPNLIARYNDKKIAALLANAGIVRNRLKVNAVVTNARALLSLQEEFDSFDTYLWKFVDGRPLQNNWRKMESVPAKTKESDAMSKDLIARGFKFVGSTICYAFMQASGMVNDHLVTCFRHTQVTQQISGTFNSVVKRPAR